MILEKIKNLLSIIFFLAAFLVGCWVYLDNNNTVTLTLFGLMVDDVTLGMLLLVTFTLGIMLGLFGNVLVTSWMAVRLRRAEKRLTAARVEQASE